MEGEIEHEEYVIAEMEMSTSRPRHHYPYRGATSLDPGWEETGGVWALPGAVHDSEHSAQAPLLVPSSWASVVGILSSLHEGFLPSPGWC